MTLSEARAILEAGHHLPLYRHDIDPRIEEVVLASWKRDTEDQEVDWVAPPYMRVKGIFTADQLEALAVWMRHHQEKRT